MSIKFALLGVICTANGLAVFSDDDATYHLRVGQVIRGYVIDKIESRRVLLTSISGVKSYLYTGDIFDLSDTMPRITSGIESKGNQIVVTEILRDFIAKEGLIYILGQAGAEPVYGADYEMVGYRFFSVDVGSVYDLAGIINDDIITEIDGTDLTSKFATIRALIRVKNKAEFSFTTIRDGIMTIKKIIVK